MTTTSAPIEVLLPELGESVTEGVVIEWRVGTGDAVSAGDILLDVTTDKVDVEIPAPAAGTVTEIIAAPGDAVEVGALLAHIDPNGAAPAEAPPAESAPAAAETAPSAEPAGEVELVPIVLGDMESVTEGTIVEWRVAVGEAVARDQIVVEISTDKVDLEVPSPADGVLAEIAFPAGETFSVAEPLGRIAAGDAPSGESLGNGSAPPQAVAPAPPPATAPDGLPDWPAISPLAKRHAIEEGIDLSAVTGGGPGGMIRRGDLVEGNGRLAPEIPPVSGENAVSLRGPAKALAAYMDDSLSIPTATSFRTLNVGRLEAERKGLNTDLKTRPEGGKLSFTHIIAWAVVRAAAEITAMNTGYDLRDGDPHRLEREFVNIGLAVDVERKDGSRSLLVPVVESAQAMTFQQFVDAFDDLVTRARDGKIKPDELRGATVSLTNPGGIGTIASVPRLMPGQGTIIATGSIAYPPGFDRAEPDTLGRLGVDKVMTMTSTYDHRVIQGAESGEFLKRVDQLLAGEDAFYAGLRESLGLRAREILLPAPQALGDGAAAVAPVAAPPAAPAVVPPAAGSVEEMMEAVSAAMSVVKAHRTYGHLAANLDPLGAPPVGDPALEPETVNLTPELMRRIPSEVLGVGVPGETFAESLHNLREIYCGTIAYEIEHIARHQKRYWLRDVIESGEFRRPLDTVRRLELLERLVQVETFERFLRRTYLGQKTFSIEGVDTMVPMIDEIIELLAADGAAEIMVGMAHRGRLAVMSHVVGRNPSAILAEFEGHMEFEGVAEDDQRETAGDVKYHLGAEGTYTTRSGNPIRVTLAANPSHLEQVNAVVEGAARAVQTIRRDRVPRQDFSRAIPILVHGDAAFTGQGVVAETLNLSSLEGYETGGTIHIISNNQIGFTTDPHDSRSTRHASDLAKGFDIPIIHVNADDVEACISAVHLSVAYRQRYRRDVVIDLIGYRRHGHNELDEPAYTQPVMARTIKDHRTVAQIYAEKLVADGVMTQERLDEVFGWAEKRMSDAHTKVKEQLEHGTFEEASDAATAPDGSSASSQLRTSVPEQTLRSLNEQLLTVPEKFHLHPKLGPQLERRREAIESGAINWGHAESLAFASLLTEGVPIRLTGQDTARGTFSQRHLELHDVDENESWGSGEGTVYVPMANLLRATAAFELHNSPLSEAATVGFEYGYSVQAPEALVLWEAQYGDFANGAQIMIDQFLVSGSAKWGQRSRLTLLLPHGYEGNGPEHSSARIERFIQLAGEENIRIAVPSTSSQYFHLLRRQALSNELHPLIIFTPKSLLRHRGANASLKQLTDGRFEAVLADPRVSDPGKVRRLLICSGKVFHDFEAHEARAEMDDLAVARLEMVYPFPTEGIAQLIESYPNLESATWVQEEPRNMGAWFFVANRLNRLLPDGIGIQYAGRPRRASPSEGYPQAHQVEQRRLVEEALGITRE
ncbi:MAG: multifunctional oxoglutarate decarboxylase/oxoglutarate dehydrogenase thiamine pyrophosphate-binding subunit/dihydrolipoyllysine-residue succinyltransferase subunit [Thermoleophilia bacterium]|nr:multifunctional oxoglutarate decarboxylase/oxoglutarate dehydrogenase thiamine pyrophosphate-binding subunit/dihydrolipoyllysine-residue succinyltransferase subunit [Thermoleophilia bacterium]